MTNSAVLNPRHDPSGLSENEGGELRYTDEHQKRGIVRSYVEVFEVGGFRYSSLEDAVAQLRRDRLGK